METPPDLLSITLTCNRSGTVSDVLQGDDALLPGLRVGGRLEDLVHRESRAKMSRFLEAIQASGTAVVWEFNLADPDAPQLWWLSGARGSHDVLITAALSLQEIPRSLHRLEACGLHPAAGTLRRAVEAHLRVLAPEMEAVLEEMSSLNNELVNTQRELGRLNARLSTLNAERARFMGIAAHDLRNPLAGILGCSELLIEETTHRLSPDHAEMLRLIASSSRFMLDIVRDFLDVTTLAAGEMALHREDLDLARFVNDRLTGYRLLARGKAITVDLEDDGAWLVVQADPSRLEQALTNLVTNAVKFSMPDTAVVIRLARTGREAVLEVTDHGQGIPPDELPKLFKPFGRTSVMATQGERSTGLGLSITKSLIEAHGGTVEVDSTPGVGTTFRIRLPLAEAAAVAA